MALDKDLLAGNLRAYRARKGILQSDVALAIGTSETAISKWESGKQSMTLANAYKIADFYEVSLDELAGRS